MENFSGFNAISSIPAKLWLDDYGYLSGTLILTDEQLIFTPDPHFPDRGFRIKLDHIIDVYSQQEEGLFISATQPFQPAYSIIIHYRDRADQVHSHRVMGYDDTPTMIASLRWIRGDKPSRSADSHSPVTVSISPPPQGLSETEQNLVNLVRAFRKDEKIGIAKLAKTLSLSEEQTTLLLSKLITNGHLEGFLQENYYIRPKEYSIQCQLCDRRLLNPSMYAQCGHCGRFVCADCLLVLEKQICPAHPNTQTLLITMPRRCDSCGVLFTDARQLSQDPTSCAYCHGTLREA